LSLSLDEIGLGFLQFSSQTSYLLLHGFKFVGFLLTPIGSPAMVHLVPDIPVVDLPHFGHLGLG
jgi:hypothetical protein